MAGKLSNEMFPLTQQYVENVSFILIVFGKKAKFDFLLKLSTFPVTLNLRTAVITVFLISKR